MMLLKRARTRALVVMDQISPQPAGNSRLRCCLFVTIWRTGNATRGNHNLRFPTLPPLSCIAKLERLRSRQDTIQPAAKRDRDSVDSWSSAFLYQYRVQ